MFARFHRTRSLAHDGVPEPDYARSVPPFWPDFLENPASYQAVVSFWDRQVRDAQWSLALSKRSSFTSRRSTRLDTIMDDLERSFQLPDQSPHIQPPVRGGGAHRLTAEGLHPHRPTDYKGVTRTQSTSTVAGATVVSGWWSETDCCRIR